jgi:hypothetical protein
VRMKSTANMPTEDLLRRLEATSSPTRSHLSQTSASQWLIGLLPQLTSFTSEQGR